MKPDRLDRESKDFDSFLLLVGKLNYAWTNTESLIIHMIAGLIRTDLETATVVFMTLNTSRARMDLVQRLSKLDRVGSDERNGIIDLTSRMQKLSYLRNRYNHCIYTFDVNSSMTHTILMRIADRKDVIKMGEMQQVDQKAEDEILETIAKLAAINQESWQFFVRYDYPRTA